MTHYKSNLRDIEFTLFEVLGRDEVLGQGPFAEVDGATAREILAEVDRIAREDLAASYEDSDRHPPVFDPETHTAPVPASFKKSYEAWMGAEYWRLSIPEELGGTPGPSSLTWAMGELVLGANAPVWMYGCGPSFAAVIHRAGNERDRRIAQIMVENAWGASMVLTEPDAGSDVGAGRAKATPNDDGSWNITGVKRFITSAEHDLSDNIVHLVLARPAGVEGVGGPGTKGLSMFIVPKLHFDHESGELDGRAQRCLRHQRRAQDGHQGVQHLRAHLRRSQHRRRRGGAGLAAGRGARRHRPDVPGHRERPDDGRHQGDRHALDGLPQRPRLRQGAGPGRRSDPRRRQDRAARHDHPPPRRTPLADDAEVLRRGHARAGALHRVVAGRGDDGRARRRGRLGPGEAGGGRQRPAPPDRQGLRLGALVDPARHRVAADAGRVGLPAGVPHRAVRPRRQDRHPLRRHDGHPGPGLLLPQDRQGPGPRAGPPGAGDRRVRRVRGRQRPAEAGADAARHRARATPTRSSAT